MPNRIETLEAELTAAKTVQRKIDAMNAIAWEFRGLGTKRGSDLAKKAFCLAQSEQYQKGIAESLITQSQFITSDFSLAISQGLQALALFEKLDDRTGQGRALFTLCWAHWWADNFIEAIEMGQRTQKLAQELGDRSLEADVLNSLGLAYKRSGNYDLALTVYNESLFLYRALDDKQRESKVLTNIALAYVLQGDYEHALASARACLQLKVNAPMVNGYTFLALGQIYTGMEEYDEGLKNLERSLFIANEQETKRLSLAAQYFIGEMYLKRQKPDLAIIHLLQALTLAKEIESNLYIYRCHEILSKIYQGQGDLAQALDQYKKFHTVKETLFNDKNTSRLQVLETHHQAEIAHREAEIYHLRNVKLEKEIIKRKHLQEELYQQATTDVLTGVSNRRHFLELASNEIVRTERFKCSLSLALIDIDHFKQVNDTYGHAMGDQMLITLARTCEKNIREIDIFARFGGDEFVLFFPEANCKQACKVVERIRLALLACPTNLQGKTVSITISSGIASFTDKHESLDVLLAHADQALYQAKAAGRNRVSVYNRILSSK